MPFEVVSARHSLPTPNHGICVPRGFPTLPEHLLMLSGLYMSCQSLCEIFASFQRSATQLADVSLVGLGMLTTKDEESVCSWCWNWDYLLQIRAARELFATGSTCVFCFLLVANALT
jgi:hypothetical protein